MDGSGWLAEAGDALLDLLYPPRCLLCDAMGRWLCDACRDGWPRPCPPLCPECGEPLGSTPCRWCSRGLTPLSGAAHACLFDAGAREAVHLLKYSGKRRLAAPMAEVMDFVARTRPSVQGADALVPIALHPTRLRHRGYNQADWLASALADLSGLPLYPWLSRVRDTPPQVGLTADQRQANVRDAFAASPACAGRRILLVDDVATTGATAREAASALRRAGAASIRLLTFARDV